MSLTSRRHLSGWKTWPMTQGAGNGYSNPGQMRPEWGNHRFSSPHHSCGMTSVLLSLAAMISALRICASGIHADTVRKPADARRMLKQQE